MRAPTRARRRRRSRGARAAPSERARATPGGGCRGRRRTAPSRDRCGRRLRRAGDGFPPPSRTGRVRQLQDPATCAWNFHTALYYKAGGTPWRLARSVSDFPSCYIGIGFYRSRDQQRIHTSVAQVFNERGQGMILRGGEAYKSEDDRQLHLTSEEMAKLVKH